MEENKVGTTLTPKIGSPSLCNYSKCKEFSHRHAIVIIIRMDAIAIIFAQFLIF